MSDVMGTLLEKRERESEVVVDEKEAKQQKRSAVLLKTATTLKVLADAGGDVQENVALVQAELMKDFYSQI